MRIARRGCSTGLAMLVGGMLQAGMCCATAADDVQKSSQPRIELHAASKTARAHFDVVGLTDRQLSAIAGLTRQQQAAAFAVLVDADLEDPPPIVGRLSITAGVLRFEPRYPLEPGLTYRAVFDPGGPSNKRTSPRDVVEAVFPIAKPDARPTTVVERIYPTSDRLPDNQLKFYIHFSAPMSRGEAYRRVHLLDADGKEVEAVFLELGEELWDGTGRRFTLYFDPGRVKRGLKPREELGPVLHAGRTYWLVVDDAWRDAKRVPLKAGARKKFSVGPPDDGPIDPTAWKLETPTAASDEPLVVRFGEPLDHALLERVLRVVSDAGEKIAGTIRIGAGESRWEFIPRQPWPAGEYTLLAQTTLEDLAGNSIGRPFEVDQFGPVQKRIETETVSLPFTIAPAR